MKYYKIIQDNNFIDVVDSFSFVRYSTYTRTFVGATEANGQFIECQGKLYRATWMIPTPNDINIDFEEAIIREIDEEEYNSLKRAIEYNETIPVNEDVVPVIVPDISDETITIDFIRSSKLNEMSYQCQHTIEQGFDLMLHGKVQHFSLTTQDQLNLINLQAMAQTETVIPYHADGEEVIFYNSEEINEIANEATKLKIYQTTYYNALKKYINALETIEDIAAIEYGVAIPEQYKSGVLKTLE